jgi:sigma54-dependent transcription regulator
MMNRRANFLAEHKRQPTREEAQQILELEREDRRAAEATRHETELRRAYLACPGADEAGWARERSAILAEDRKERALQAKDAARRAQSVIYKEF